MQVRELTLRGLVLGALITTVFTAANVYLGLKVGLTFASSIPAAVISMAVLSLVRNSSILENNIVQTAEVLKTLVASGLIVGESLFGVLNAGLIVGFSNDAPLALVPATFPHAKVLGLLVFAALVVWLYGWMLTRARRQTGGG